MLNKVELSVENNHFFLKTKSHSSESKGKAFEE